MTREAVFGPVDPEPEALRLAPLDPIALSRELVRDEPGVFTIEVHGDAMRDAMLGEGDVVIVQQVSRVAHGELAAVWLAGARRLALRRVYFEGESVRLQPESRHAEPERTGPAGYEVRGRVMAIVRQPRAADSDLADSDLAEAEIGETELNKAELAEAFGG